MPERIDYLGPNHRVIVDDTANTWKLQFYDSAAAVWKDIMAFKSDTQKITRLVAYDELAVDTIRLEEHISFGGTRIGLAADAVGVKYEAGSHVITADDKKHLKSALLEVVLSRITGGTLAIELYDYTAAVVRASVSLTAATRRATATVAAADLVTGNEIGVRWNITTAGASGTVFDADPVRLIFVYGVS